MLNIQRSMYMFVSYFPGNIMYSTTNCYQYSTDIYLLHIICCLVGYCLFKLVSTHVIWLLISTNFWDMTATFMLLYICCYNRNITVWFRRLFTYRSWALPPCNINSQPCNESRFSPVLYITSFIPRKMSRVPFLCLLRTTKIGNDFLYAKIYWV